MLHTEAARSQVRIRPKSIVRPPTWRSISLKILWLPDWPNNAKCNLPTPSASPIRSQCESTPEAAAGLAKLNSPIWCANTFRSPREKLSKLLIYAGLFIRQRPLMDTLATATGQISFHLKGLLTDEYTNACF